MAALVLDASTYRRQPKIAATGVTPGVTSPALPGGVALQIGAFTGGISGWPVVLPSQAEHAMPGDFTIEGYAYWSAASSGTPNYLVFLIGPSWFIRRTAAGKLAFFNGGTDLIVGPTTIPINTAVHWALVRSGSTIELWLDGVSQGTTSLATSVSANAITLGSDNSGTNVLNGYLSQVRITVGVARYSAGFVPAYAAWPTGVGGDANWMSVIALITGAAATFDKHAIDSAHPTRAYGTVTPAYSKGARVVGCKLFNFSQIPPFTTSRNLSGRYRITGTTKAVGTPDYPVGRLVRLFSEREGALVDATWSDPTTGAYEFNWLRGDIRYTVISYDYAGVFRAVIADNQLPTAMP